MISVQKGSRIVIDLIDEVYPSDGIEQSKDRPRRRRNRAIEGGKGCAANSWKKHELIAQCLSMQAAILAHTVRGRGLIIDMHAGDGIGADAAQLDLFGLNKSRTTPEMAIGAARSFGADVVLCEKDGQRREKLEIFADRATILQSFEAIQKDVLPDRYSWVITISDPNGPASQGADIMTWIAERNRTSDFIIVVNTLAILRMAGLKPEDPADAELPNARLVKDVRAARDRYAWMKDGEGWRSILSKKKAVRSVSRVKNPAFQGRVFLVSNFIGNLHRRMFEPC